MAEITITHINNIKLTEDIVCEYKKNGKNAIHLIINNRYFRVFNRIFGSNSFIESTKLKFGMVLNNEKETKFIMKCKFIGFDQNKIYKSNIHGKHTISRWLKTSKPRSNTFKISLNDTHTTNDLNVYNQYLIERGYGSLNIEEVISKDVLVANSYLDKRGCLFRISENEFKEWVNGVLHNKTNGFVEFRFFSNTEYGKKPSLKVYKNNG